MKNSVPIPSDVWEEKRTLIATLYKDEEWPLKQVIKKIRSDNFNPSETQLRSRLKKWRVTKPSRQTRKKSEETTKELFHETNFPKRHSNNSSPETQPRSRPLPSATETVVTEQEWYVANKAYEPHGLTASSGGGRDIPAAWDPNSSYSSPQISPEKSRVSSHASLVITTPPSYDPPQPSPLMDGALLNSTSTMTPTFTNSPYALGADHSMPTPASTTTAVPEIQWAMPQWYSMPIETTTQASSMPFYASGPLTPPIDPMVHIISQQPIQQISESRDGLKSWEPPVSGPFNPELAAQLSQKARQPPKPLEKEVPHPLKISTSQYPGGVATPTSPFFHHGPYSSLCSPGYAYPGPETLVHRPSIEF